jgi:hypothetical protein
MSCVLITLAAFAACADLDTGFDPAFGLGDEVVAVPTFSGDVQPILTRRCVVGGCHTLASAQGGLSLDPSDSYESLVNVPSLLHEGLDRVEPFDPGASWLVRMIEADPAGRDGRPRMPLASSPLTPNQIATIVNWIERGAPND